MNRFKNIEENQMKKPLLISLIAFILTCHSWAAGRELEVKMDILPAGFFIVKSEKIKGKVETKGDSITASKISVKVQSFTSGIVLRDEHFKKAFSSENIEMTDIQGQGGSAIGMLHVNGISKKVSFKYAIKNNTLMAQIIVNYLEFNMKKVDYQDKTVAEKVKIKVTIPLK